ncbi:MAG: hypothetical protein ACJAT1_000463 [Marivirga sp.]|jgi:hypothetical protein
MFYLPQYKEALVSPLDKDEVLRRLNIAVKHAKRQSLHHQKLDGPELELYLFNGLVSASAFSISLVIDKPENFYPLINGHLVAAKEGCEVSIEYALFQSVKIFYFFWLLLLTIIGLFTFFENNEWYWLAVTVVIQLASFFVIQSRFRAGLRKSRKELHRLIF